MPSSFQGLFSFKPSSGRISFKDVANTVNMLILLVAGIDRLLKKIQGQGQQVMPTVVGLIGNSLATLKLVFKSLLSTEPWLHDSYALPIPWRGEKEYKAEKEGGYKPAFGFFANDGIVTPHPPVSRALRIVSKALEESGYEVCTEQKWRRCLC